MSFMLNVRPGVTPLVVTAVLACTCASPAWSGDLVFLDDFEGGATIPWVRHNTDFAAGAFFVLQPAIVTATKLTNSDTQLTLFLQVSGGADPAPYPQWSAIEAFGNATGTVPAVGDCVRVMGTVTKFRGATELAPMSWVAAPAFDCGNHVIVPSNVSLSDIATDLASAVPGNQPGTLAEAYESALLTLTNAAVLTSPTNGTFEIYAQNGSPSTYLSVDDFLYQYGAILGTHFSSMTGVLQENDSATDPVYQLLPRAASDVVTGP